MGGANIWYFPEASVKSQIHPRPPSFCRAPKSQARVSGRAMRHWVNSVCLSKRYECSVRLVKSFRDLYCPKRNARKEKMFRNLWIWIWVPIINVLSINLKNSLRRGRQTWFSIFLSSPPAPPFLWGVVDWFFWATTLLAYFYFALSHFFFHLALLLSFFSPSHLHETRTLQISEWDFQSRMSQQAGNREKFQLSCMVRDTACCS